VRPSSSPCIGAPRRSVPYANSVAIVFSPTFWPVGKLLRRIAFVLLLWLLIVFAITTAVRVRLERPTVYIG